jgi:hypothetical protein
MKITLKQIQNSLIKNYFLKGKRNIKKQILFSYWISLKGNKYFFNIREYKAFKKLFCL